ncbi:MAG: fibronectin type III domain-containing protein [Muribaculaceae bacterium]|nr:fibronectin type III domain-containing protein [Muribaculaceae bacterium]
MFKFKKAVMMLGLLLASSSVLVGCSDDDDPGIFGAPSVNSLQTTTTSATVYWTRVPNSSCDGYQIKIYEGTRENIGTPVVDQTFDNRTSTFTFTGLRPNTSYVINAKCIPSASSGYTQADAYEMQFMTAPLVGGLSLSQITYTVETKYDADGQPYPVATGEMTGSWTALTSNAGGYSATLFRQSDNGSVTIPEKSGKWAALSTVNFTDSIEARSAKFTGIDDKGGIFCLGVNPRPSNGEWYPAGERTYSANVTVAAYEY